MAVACRECEQQIAANALFCLHCGTTQYPDLVRRSAVAVPEAEPVHDPWLLHALRFTGVGLLLILAWATFILGLAWRLRINDVTGYRKRDVLWEWVPIVGTIAETRTLWRYTARDEYWTPRDDRPSEVLHGWARPVAIGLGWLAVPALAAGAGVAAVNGDDGRCVRDEVRQELDAQDDFTFGHLGDAIDGALEQCDVQIDLGGRDTP